jgi:hypothetical protein
LRETKQLKLHGTGIDKSVSYKWHTRAKRQDGVHTTERETTPVSVGRVRATKKRVDNNPNLGSRA